jgi:hypothetical protein
VGAHTPSPEHADHADHAPLLQVRVWLPQLPHGCEVGPVQVHAPQSTSCPQSFFATPHGVVAHVVVFVSGTHWHVDEGEPTQLSLAAQAVQRVVSWQPCVTSVGTHLLSQFFVFAEHVPTWHVLPLHTSMPPPGFGHALASQVVSPQP